MTQIVSSITSTVLIKEVNLTCASRNGGLLVWGVVGYGGESGS